MSLLHGSEAFCAPQWAGLNVFMFSTGVDMTADTFVSVISIRGASGRKNLGGNAEAYG